VHASLSHLPSRPSSLPRYRHILPNLLPFEPAALDDGILNAHQFSIYLGKEAGREVKRWRGKEGGNKNVLI